MSPKPQPDSSRPPSAAGRDPHWSAVVLAIGGTIFAAVLVSVAGTMLLS
jgi:hypothetical protein